VILMRVLRLTWLALTASAAFVQPAQAGLFEDDEARKAILELRGKVQANEDAAKQRAEQLNGLIQDQIQPLRRSLLDLNGQIDALRANRMPLRVHAAEWVPEVSAAEALAEQTLVLTEFEELPFATQSLDLVVLPHALELSPDPHHLLREAERVLAPEGKLIVSCFNPYSLWGARQFAGRVLGKPFLPRAGQFISLPRVKDWLKLLDFEVEGGKFGCYRPACRAQPWLDRTRFMDAAGDRWWPVLGAVYLLQAVKRVRGMRLIGPAWKTRRQRAAGLASAAQRGTSKETLRKTA